MARKQFHPCSIKQLPLKEQHAAAMFAIKTNPVNRPQVEHFASMTNDGSKIEAGPRKLAIAMATSKYFGPTGVNLTVGFLSQVSAVLADRIISHMNAWNQWANVNFTMHSGAASRAQIRITTGQGGYWSYLGTDTQRIAQGQPTMNLQGFSMSTSEAEFRRVVRHETGHTLGCPHEHMRRQIVDLLDPAKTYAYFQRTQGWSRQEVDQQVLTAISEASIKGTLNAEHDSIMCYQLPGAITRDNRPIIGGVDITQSDGVFMGTMFPKSIITPPPPSGKRRIVLDVDGMTASIVSVT